MFACRLNFFNLTVTTSSRGLPARSDLFEGSGVPIIEEAWQWNPREILLRDYYANSLMTFEEVKGRGWPERKKG